MYTRIERRKTNPDTIQQVRERAEKEFFSPLQASDGFVGFYVVNDQEQGEHAVIMVWNTKEQGEAFLSTQSEWMKVPEEMGQMLISLNSGDTMVDLGPNR